jgi:predicted nucleic acid-binding protein
MIVDTDVLVWELRGNEKAKRLLHSLIPFHISVVTYVELIQGMRNKQEQQILSRQLARWNVHIIHIEQDISARAMIYVEEYYLSHSMELADALIAASCISMSEELITANEKHYRHIPNITISTFTP